MSKGLSRYRTGSRLAPLHLAELCFARSTLPFKLRLAEAEVVQLHPLKLRLSRGRS